MRWLIVLMCSMILMACHTKKVATQETYNLHALNALQWDEQDTVTIMGRPSWFPYLEPSSSMNSSVCGDSVTTIIRHRKVTATNQHERSDTTATIKNTDSHISISPGSINHTAIKNVIYLSVFVFFIVCCIAVVVRRNR